MNQFEYLSVLISIIIGLGLSHLLSSAARLIQLRHRARLYAPTLAWMASLLLAQIQIWWVAFDRRGVAQWNFYSFLLYLLIPIGAYVLSYLIVPDLDSEDGVDLKASYYANQSWFFGILAAILSISLGEEFLRDGHITGDVDALFRVGFLLIAGIAMRVRREWFHALTSALFLLLFCAYVLLLFVQLK